MRAMAIAVPAMRRAIVPAPGAIVTAIVMIAIPVGMVRAVIAVAITVWIG